MQITNNQTYQKLPQFCYITILHYASAGIQSCFSKCINWMKLCYPDYNPLGNLNSGRRPWAKLIRSASLQRVFDAAIAKWLWRLVSRCFYITICVFSTITLNWGEWHKTFIDSRHSQMATGDTERFLTVMYAVCRLLDKLHIFSNILCTCNIFIKMWAQI